MANGLNASITALADESNPKGLDLDNGVEDSGVGTVEFMISHVYDDQSAMNVSVMTKPIPPITPIMTCSSRILRWRVSIISTNGK